MIEERMKQAVLENMKNVKTLAQSVQNLIKQDGAPMVEEIMGMLSSVEQIGDSTTT